MARRHNEDDGLCRFERLNACRLLAGRPPIGPRPYRGRVDRIEAELDGVLAGWPQKGSVS